MGSTGYPRGVTFTEAIREELGIGTHYRVLAKAAGEPDEPGRNVTWFALEKIADPTNRFILEVLWYPASDRSGPTIKLVDENMGPGTLDVPDRVWNAVPEASPHANDYSIEWRKQVAEHKARYPLRIADLNAGEWIVFPEREHLGDDHAVLYDGLGYSGRRAVKVFVYPPESGWESSRFGYGSGTKYRLRRTQERFGRARRAKRPSWA